MEKVILGLLLMKSLTIYDMNKAFNSGISLFYSASYGSLQIAVKKLIAKGLIDYNMTTENGRKKKIYFINEQGRAEFQNWMFEEIPLKKLEVTALSKLYFLGLLKDDEKLLVLKHIIVKIEELEVNLNKMMLEYNSLFDNDDIDSLSKYQLKTLSYGQASQHFSKSWFVDLYDEIKRKNI